jgi:predicted nucleic acid-binding protein
MTVVSNTGPLNYLIVVGAVHHLPTLYSTLLVPQEVLGELCHQGAPVDVRTWAQDPPEWVLVPSSSGSARADASLAFLGAGEAAVIATAEAVGADLLLIDERAGRSEAERRGFRVTGTLGVLDRAAVHGLLDFRASIDSLRKTRFRADSALVDALLEAHDRRSRP